jgi:outer membrane protein, multidrug efflux system
LRQSRASRDLATASLFPSLTASASANRSMTGTDAGGSGKSRTLYAAGFDASWEPSIFGGLTDAARGAEADAAAAAASLEATQVSLAAEVALEYIALRTYQTRLGIASDNVASQAETLQLTYWRAQAGLATTLDVEQARTNLEQTKASIPGLENGRAQAEHRLAVLTGQPPGTLRERLAEAKALPKAPEDVAVGVPADTLRQRPDVRAAQLTLQAEIARTAQQQAARYPSLSLSGSFGWQSLSAAALGGGGSLARSLAASLATTLFDGGRIRSRIARQDAVQEQALVAYEKSILTALEDVENALAGYATGRQAVEARRQAAVSAGNAAKLARALYQAGATDFQKVLETDRTRLSAEDGLASAESDVLVSVISLYKALGGGWQAATPSAQKQS